MRWLALALALFTATLAAASYTKFEAVTVAAASTGFTAANINAGSGHPAATQATCRLETAEIRYTVDGTTPSAAVGTLLEIGDTLALFGNDTLNNFRGFRTGGSSGVLDCTYAGAY